jgi:hypothetical protein
MMSERGDLHFIQAPEHGRGLKIITLTKFFLHQRWRKRMPWNNLARLKPKTFDTDDNILSGPSF